MSHRLGSEQPRIDHLIKHKGYLKMNTESLETAKEDCLELLHDKDQTEEICLEAVKENGYALRYVKDQKEDICAKAVNVGIKISYMQ